MAPNRITLRRGARTSASTAFASALSFALALFPRRPSTAPDPLFPSSLSARSLPRFAPPSLARPSPAAPAPSASPAPASRSRRFAFSWSFRARSNSFSRRTSSSAPDSSLAPPCAFAGVFPAFFREPPSPPGALVRAAKNLSGFRRSITISPGSERPPKKSSPGATGSKASSTAVLRPKRAGERIPRLPRRTRGVYVASKNARSSPVDVGEVGCRFQRGSSLAASCILAFLDRFSHLKLGARLH